MTASDIPADTVYLVVGDDQWRDRLRADIEAHSPWLVRPYADGLSWLDAAARMEPGCVLLDLDRSPDRSLGHSPGDSGVSGADVVARMKACGAGHAAVMLSDGGTIAPTVSAMKAGAVDVVEKPTSWDALAPSIAAAFHQVRDSKQRRSRRARAEMLLQRLSPRERDVMLGMIEGLPNKLIAFRLGLSPRTVEVHRASLMAKLEMTNLAELLRCALAAGLVED